LIWYISSILLLDSYQYKGTKKENYRCN